MDLKALGVRPEGIEISGGEPFLYEHRLIDILGLVKDVYGPGSRVQVQTNAFWCKTDDVVRGKYESLRDSCVFVISSVDFFHFEYIPVSFVRRSLLTAADVFNMRNNAHFMHELKEYPPGASVSVAEAVAHEGVGIDGNAAFSLAPFIDSKSPDSFSDVDCSDILEEYGKVHIDPYGNVFPPCRCIGILLGNVRTHSGGLPPIVEESRAGNPPNEVVRILATLGPYGLFQEAVRRGYNPLERGYASECHLCYMVRHYLFTHGHYTQALGPAEVYEPTADKTLGSQITIKSEEDDHRTIGCT